MKALKEPDASVDIVVRWAVIAFVVALPILPPAGLAFLTVGLGVLLVWAEVSGARPRNSGLMPMAFLAAFVASLVLGTWRAPDWRVGAMVLSFLVPGLILYALIVRHWDRQAVMPLCVTLSVCSLLVSIAIFVGTIRASATTLVEGIGFTQHAIWLSGSYLLVVPNDSTIVAVLAAFQMPLLVDPSVRRSIKVVAAVTLVAAVGAIALSASRTATLALVTGLAVYFGLRSWKRLGIALLAGSIAVVVVDYLLGGALAQKTLGATNENRLELWSAAWAMFVEKPVLGHGLGSFWALQLDYLPFAASFHRAIPWAHNLFLETLAEQGAVGAVVLIALLGRGAYLGIQAIRRPSASTAYTVAAVAALSAFTVAAALELTLLRRWVPIVLLLVLGILERTAAQQGEA